MPSKISKISTTPERLTTEENLQMTRTYRHYGLEKPMSTAEDKIPEWMNQAINSPAKKVDPEKFKNIYP